LPRLAPPDAVFVVGLGNAGHDDAGVVAVASSSPPPSPEGVIVTRHRVAAADAVEECRQRVGVGAHRRGAFGAAARRVAVRCGRRALRLQSKRVPAVDHAAERYGIAQVRRAELRELRRIAQSLSLELRAAHMKQ